MFAQEHRYRPTSRARIAHPMRITGAGAQRQQAAIPARRDSAAPSRRAGTPLEPSPGRTPPDARESPRIIVIGQSQPSRTAGRSEAPSPAFHRRKTTPLHMGEGPRLCAQTWSFSPRRNPQPQLPQTIKKVFANPHFPTPPCHPCAHKRGPTPRRATVVRANVVEGGWGLGDSPVGPALCRATRTRLPLRCPAKCRAYPASAHHATAPATGHPKAATALRAARHPNPRPPIRCDEAHSTGTHRTIPDLRIVGPSMPFDRPEAALHSISRTGLPLGSAFASQVGCAAGARRRTHPGPLAKGATPCPPANSKRCSTARR
jgi:hypothetical protein